MQLLDTDQFYRALIARDTRFDGVFFVGVTSTGVYCRPVCRAPKPRPHRCRYFSIAAAAERHGLRPCLRCRPELAPGDAHGSAAARDGASIDAVAQLARAAAARIATGALDRGGLDDLAAELGVSARHLRRAVERELGVTPVELAQTQRLLTAKRLLGETGLSITQVAFTSGFGSLRRFNTLFRARYQLAPSAIRRGVTVEARTPETVSVTLAYRPPFDWEALRGHLAARATPGVEAVSTGGGGRYARTIQLHGHRGHIVVSDPAGTTRRRRVNVLELRLSATLLPVLVPLLARVRRLLDLDADPQTIVAHLEHHRSLGPLVARRPGLRVPGAVDGFELALRTVLGQQVTVRGATTLAGRLAQLVAEPLAEPAQPPDGWHPAPPSLLPVTAERLADASLASVIGIGLPRARAECVRALARAVATGELSELTGDAPAADPHSFARRFTELPGIGPWTAAYVAMRALRWPDAFPEGDLALRKAMGGLTPAQLLATAEAWRPWRAYAAQHLWASLS